MKIQKLTCWENRRRTEILVKFRELTVSYFNEIHRERNAYRQAFGHEDDDDNVNESASKARSEMNRLMKQVRTYLHTANSLPVVTHYPAPRVGGYVKEIDIFSNIFDLRQWQIPPDKIVDSIEQAIGVYEADYPAAVRRTFNPFFWIGKGLSAISSFPFAILEHAGLGGRKLEDSFTGKLIKLTTEIIALLSSLYVFLKLIGKETIVTRLFS